MGLTGWAGIGYEEKRYKISQSRKTVDVKPGWKDVWEVESSFVFSRAIPFWGDSSPGYPFY